MTLSLPPVKWTCGIFLSFSICFIGDKANGVGCIRWKWLTACGAMLPATVRTLAISLRVAAASKAKVAPPEKPIRCTFWLLGITLSKAVLKADKVVVSYLFELHHLLFLQVGFCSMGVN